MMTKNATMSKAVTASEMFLDSKPEDTYTTAVSATHRKQFGQFFTPAPIAEFMAKWIISNSNCQTILDPSVGLGIFFRAINKIQHQNNFKLIGYDIDPRILVEAKILFSNLGYTDVELKIKDYLFNDWTRKYDGIICNPPYFKFQDYKNRTESLKEFRSRLKMDLSGFTNIYSMFILKSINQLAANGRAAYIVPFEFLNSDYGTNVKKYLLENKTLKNVIVFDSSGNVFENALTTSCILLFSKDKKYESVNFINVKNTDNLIEILEQIKNYPAKSVGKTMHFSELNPNKKWRLYYEKQSSRKFKNLVPLSVYGKAVRGIATGDNEYFTFNEKKKAEFNINDKYLLPCLTKAIQAKSNFFTQVDFDKLRSKEHKIYLFNAFNLDDNAVKKYIEVGEKLKVNEKYLTSHRNPWYAIENRSPAPILVTVFNRNGLRFVRNEANVRNLTSFHGIYLNMFAESKINLLMAYFISDISKEILDKNRREYGGGLNKFEPNDLNRAEIIDIEKIDSKTEKQIEINYARYRKSFLNSKQDLEALNNLNNIFSAIILE